MTEALRQAFHQNGEPIVGKGIAPETARKNGNLVGIVRVLLWRDNQGRPEILAQKRVQKKVQTYGYEYDLAVGGHIDLGETRIQTAIREADEELRIKIDPEKLHALSMFRISIDKGDRKIRNLIWMYSYQLKDERITPNAEEVDSVEWLSPDECINFIKEKKSIAREDIFRNNLNEIERQLKGVE